MRSPSDGLGWRAFVPAFVLLVGCGFVWQTHTQRPMPLAAPLSSIIPSLDGYTVAERAKFQRDARKLSDTLLSTEPFKSRRADSSHTTTVRARAARYLAAKLFARGRLGSAAAGADDRRGRRITRHELLRAKNGRRPTSSTTGARAATESSPASTA
jgi:hypothetical protein